jgi:hypothetical protein
VIAVAGFDGLRVAAAPIWAPEELISETPGNPKSVHVEVPLFVKSRIVKSVPAPAPPLPSVMCRFDVKQDAALAGALLVGAAGVGLEAWLAGVLAEVLAEVLAGETPDCVAEGWLVACPPAPELCELQPTARIAAMAAIPPVSEFWTIRALRAMGQPLR